MNYVGKRVRHSAKFGTGLIIAQDQNNHITVKFDASSVTRTFIAPACFVSFLELQDPETEKQAIKEARVHEEKEVAEKAKKEQEQRLKIFERQAKAKQPKSGAGKNAEVPHYDTVDEFYDEQEKHLISR